MQAAWAGLDTLRVAWSERREQLARGAGAGAATAATATTTTALLLSLGDAVGRAEEQGAANGERNLRLEHVNYEEEEGQQPEPGPATPRTLSRLGLWRAHS